MIFMELRGFSSHLRLLEVSVNGSGRGPLAKSGVIAILRSDLPDKSPDKGHLILVVDSVDPSHDVVLDEVLEWEQGEPSELEQILPKLLRITDVDALSKAGHMLRQLRKKEGKDRSQYLGKILREIATAGVVHVR